MKPFLSRSQFIDRLRIEKRRADRSKSPLSIALLSLRKSQGGGGEPAREFLESLRKNTRETDIQGWVDHESIGLILPDTDEKGAQRFAGKIAEGNGHVELSVVTGTYPDQLFQQLLSSEESHPDFFPLDLDEMTKPRRFQSALKRVMDIAGACVGLILFSPILFLTGLAIKLTSPGPVIFRQSRFGRKGVQFPFYKFRSMYMNADDRIHRDYVTNLIKGELQKIDQGDGEKHLYKMKSDPRITPVGKIIRKTSIDEFPQFFNVLKGEMSLVGPRPPLPYEVEKYEPWHLRRILEVKPGITGLWQVDGRSKTSFDDMVRLDLRYVRTWSFWLDVKILLKTVKAVLRPQGAL
jgi:exopolysaccharide biosynthesis polyprenyl glycosylphosphotransferase